MSLFLLTGVIIQHMDVEHTAHDVITDHNNKLDGLKVDVLDVIIVGLMYALVVV